MPIRRTQSTSAVGASSNPSQPAQYTPGVSTDQQFYVTGNHVWQRTFQPSSWAWPRSRASTCASTSPPSSSTSMNYVTNLNPGDNSQYFPEATRCVLFQVA